MTPQLIFCYPIKLVVLCLGQVYVSCNMVPLLGDVAVLNLERIGFCVALFILAIFVFNWGRTWLRAYVSGAPVKFMELIALQIRSIPAKPIVETRIVLIKSGFNVSVDDLSTHYLAGGDVHMVMQGLLKAKEKNIDLSFLHACALDLQDKVNQKKED